MAILAECPKCKRIQSLRNKVCIKCELNLDKAKRSGRVQYYVSFRYPGGKQRRELVGNSIEEARDAEGKRRGRKGKGDFLKCCRTRISPSQGCLNGILNWTASEIGLPTWN